MITSAFFDIDGTLLGEQTGNLIPEGTKRALAELRRRGVRLFISSGRSKAQLPPCITDGFPGLEGGFDGYITMTGSYCYDKDGVFADTPIDPAIAERFVRLVERGDFDALALMGDRVFSSHHSEKVRELERRVDFSFPPDDIRRALDGPVYQFCAFVTPDEEGPIREAMGDCIVTRWCDLFCDIVPATSSKPKGIQATLEHFGLTREGTIAFGDGGNDATMLEYCEIGVAMGNGTADAKASADYVTAPLDEDGIAKALRHFGAIG